MDINKELINLKDIHLPEAVSIWPLAFGWYLIFFIIIFLIIFLCIFFRKRYQKKKFKSLVRKELNIFKKRSKLECNNVLLGEISIFLKQVAMHHYPKSNLKLIHGYELLKYFDEIGKTNFFVGGQGKILLSIYDNEDHTLNDDFFNSLDKWLETIL